MAISDLSQGTKDRLIGLVFGLGGLASSPIFLIIEPSPLGSGHRESLYILLIPGASLVVGLTISYAICRSLEIIGQVRVPSWRLLPSITLASLMGFCGTFGGILVGVLAALMTAQPVVNGRVIPPSHPLLIYVFPTILGLTCGTLLVTTMLCIALSVLTEKWDKRRWSLTMLPSFALVVAAISLHPGLFNLQRMMTDDYGRNILNDIVRSLYIGCSCIYGVCAGYWLAESGDTIL